MPHSCARRWLNARMCPSRSQTSMPSAAESKVARNSASKVSSSRSVASLVLRSTMVNDEHRAPPWAQRHPGHPAIDGEQAAIGAQKAGVRVDAVGDHLCRFAPEGLVLRRGSEGEHRRIARVQPLANRSVRAAAALQQGCRRLDSSTSQTASCNPSIQSREWLPSRVCPFGVGADCTLEEIADPFAGRQVVEGVARKLSWLEAAPNSQLWHGFQVHDRSIVPWQRGDRAR